MTIREPMFPPPHRVAGKPVRAFKRRRAARQPPDDKTAVRPHGESGNGLPDLTAIPVPHEALAALARLRAEAVAEIERLMQFLDERDGDPDLEPNDGGAPSPHYADEAEGDHADDEPSLGWTDMESRFPGLQKNGTGPAEGGGTRPKRRRRRRKPAAASSDGSSAAPAAEPTPSD